jgi:nucleotide-binding universal stress UspA family protein
MGRIVVGVDGSEGSVLALRWAVEEARLREATVEAVHAWTYPMVAGPMGAIIPPVPREDLERTAGEVLEEALQEAQVEGKGVEIARRIVEGPPAVMLVQQAESADLLVIGSRGHGGFTGLFLGSVSHQCAQRASCPVVIIPQRHESDQS